MSGILATILGIISGALILVALGAIWYNRRFKHPPVHSPSAAPIRSPQEELSALGILEIKPRTSQTITHESKEDEEGDVEIIDVESDQTLPAETMKEDDDDDIAYPGETDDASEEIVIEDVEFGAAAKSETAPKSEARRFGVSRREALFRLLNAVQASVDGYTACLIKKEYERCHVEAIVSQNPQSLGPKELTLDALLEGRVLEGAAVFVIDLDAGKPVDEVLGYYREPVPVRQVAIAPINSPGDEEAHFLLVDALGWQDLDDPWQRLMIGQFATLVGTFMSTPLTESEAGQYIKPRVKPRREIIAEEMERARSGKHPLALALIYLNRAEEIASEGGKAISDAERAMANRLELAVNGGRLERFGELTYGIFQDEGVSEVEAWALKLQQELLREGEYFDGGVSIGIALLQDRHKNADDFRADATEALREAFETGACTIIE